MADEVHICSSLLAVRWKLTLKQDICCGVEQLFVISVVKALFLPNLEPTAGSRRTVTAPQLYIT